MTTDSTGLAVPAAVGKRRGNRDAGRIDAEQTTGVTFWPLPLA